MSSKTSLRSLSSLLHRSQSRSFIYTFYSTTPMSSTTIPLRLSLEHIGLGTWQAPPGKVGKAVQAADRAGYRFIDCAFVYGNQVEIGKALQELCQEGYKRSDLIITSKVFNSHHYWDENFSSTTLTSTLYIGHLPFATRNFQMNPFEMKLDVQIQSCRPRSSISILGDRCSAFASKDSVATLVPATSP